MKVIPVGSRVLLKPIKGESKTKSGLYLPKQEDKKEGIVESVGTLKDSVKIPLEKGNHVMYGGYSNEEIEFNGEKFIMVDFKDIIAKIEH